MANKITKDTVELEARINSEPATGSIKEMKKELKTLQTELEKLPVASEEFNQKLEEIAAKSKELDGVTQKLKDIKAASQDVGKGTEATTGALGKMATMFDTIQKAFLPLLALKGVFDILSSGMSMYTDQAAGTNQLTNALHGNIAAVEQLDKVAQELEAQSLFDDNEITKGQAQLATLKATKEEIAAVNTLMLDYAEVKKVDAVASAEAFGKALNGEAGELADYGVVLTDTMTRSERLAEIQRALGETVAGAAKTAAESGANSWTVLKNKANDALEYVGGAVVTFLESTNTVTNAVNAKLDEVATKYRNASEEQKEVFRKNLEAQGQSIETITNRIAELEQKERAEAAKTRAELLGKYNDLTNAEKEFYANRARALGISEEVIAKFQTDAITKSKEEEAAARKAELEANKSKYEAAAAQAKAARDKTAAEEAAAAKQLAALRIAAIEDEQIRLKAQATAKAESDIASLKGTAAQRAEAEKLIREALGRDLAAIDQKYIDLKAAADAKAAADKAALDAKALADSQAAKDKAAADALARLDATHANAMAILDIQVQEQLTKAIDNEGQKAIIEENAQMAALDAQGEYLRQRLALLVQSGTAEASAIEAAGNAILANDTKVANQRALNAQRTTKVKQESEKIAMKTASDGLDALVGLLSKDEEARKKNAAAIKVLRTSQVVIDVISEIQAIWKNNNSNPTNALIPGFGTALSIAQTAIAAARAATAVAQINATKYERGGQWLGGSRHSDGGNPIVDSRTGQIIGEVESGEVILSRNTVANNAAVVQALLSSSMYRNGQRIYETGGVFTSAALNTTPSQRSAETVAANATAANIALLNAATDLVNTIGNMPKEIKAKVVYSELEAASNEINVIRNQAKI
jgi:hypothetical protein